MTPAERHVEAGHNAYALGHWELALSHYSQALKLNQELLEVRQRVAELLHRLNRTDSAIKEYQRVAGAYALGGNLFKSVAISNVITQLDPEHTETPQALAQVFGRHPTPQPRVTALPSRMATPTRPQQGMPRVTPPGMVSAPLMMGAVTPSQLPHRAATPGPHEQVLEVDGVDVREVTGVTNILVNPAELPVVPLFSDLPPVEFVAVLKEAKLRTHHPGDAVVTEGDDGSSMFVVIQGRVEVRRQRPDGVAQVLAQLAEGSFFGEMALLHGTPRLASVVALTEVMLLELTRESVDRIVARHPEVHDVLERFYRQRMLDNLMRSSRVFKPLSPEQRDAVVARFEPVTRAAGEFFLRQDQEGDGFYVLARGKVTPVHNAPDGQTRNYPDLAEGDVFGEMSLLFNKPVSASVKAATAATALRLSRADFESLVLTNAEAKALLLEISAQRRKRTADVMTSILLGLENFRV